ncbi:MAG: hypothetical protein QG625_4330 [Cyanobacteriota bacterium erpe_2018_sw_39hr_WHONDRS-SW48-000098_B_bin.30]|nr:hypothetical protein [Cyanobacteriota bacterium erpe_2018_sw_39hr_WHONDRS-SW48-000098_B_bin.30]
MQDTWFFGIPGRLLRNFKIATLLIVPLALAGLFAAALAKAPKMLDVTELDMQSNTFGSGTLYVRPDGIKWDIARHNFYYAAYAPDWQLMVYNTRTKLGRKQAYLHWKNYESPRESMKVTSITTKDGLFLGLAARRVTMHVEPLDSFSSKTELMYQDAQDRARAFTSVELLESAWINLTPQQIEFVRYIAANPKVQGLVLKQENVFPSGKREKILDTLALRNGKIKSEDWRYPATFTPASIATIREEKQRGIEAAEMLGTFILDKPSETIDTTSSAGKSKNVPAKTATRPATKGQKGSH